MDRLVGIWRAVGCGTRCSLDLSLYCWVIGLLFRLVTVREGLGLVTVVLVRFTPDCRGVILCRIVVFALLMVLRVILCCRTWCVLMVCRGRFVWVVFRFGLIWDWLSLLILLIFEV